VKRCCAVAIELLLVLGSGFWLLQIPEREMKRKEKKRLHRIGELDNWTIGQFLQPKRVKGLLRRRHCLQGVQGTSGKASK
jgi:hypothetical protein